MNNEDPNRETSFFDVLEDSLEDVMNGEDIEEEEIEESEASQESSPDFDRDRFDYDEDLPNDKVEKDTNEVPSDKPETGETGPEPTPESSPEVTPENGSELNKAPDKPGEPKTPEKIGEGPNESPKPNDVPNNKFKGDHPEAPKLYNNNPSNPSNFGKNKPFNNNPGAGLAKEGAEDAAKEGLKKGSEEAAKQVAKEGAKELAKEGAKEVAKEGAKDLAKVGAGAVAEGGKDAAIAGGAGAVAGGAGGAGAAAGGAGAAAGAGGAVAGGPYAWIAIAVIIVIIVIVVVLIVVAIISIILLSLYNYGKNDQSEFNIVNTGTICKMVTVTDTKDDSDGTYAFEDYIAGVVQKEIGQFNDTESFKTFAIAARSYFYKNHSNCSIKGNDTKQAFTKNGITDKVRNAVKDTEGLVVTKNGSIVSVMYDGLAVEEYDREKVRITQRDQIIPRDWLTSKKIGESSIIWYQNHKHGKGLSQIGTWYLTETSGLTYQQIYRYYLGDEYKILKLTEFEYYPGIDPTDTKGNELHQPLGEFLANHGSSTEAFNKHIYSNVRQQGVGTRAGVVTAASTLISTISNTYGYRLPYTYGGGHGNGTIGSVVDTSAAHYGINPSWGTYLGSKGYYSGGYGPYYYYGPDCSAFVAWAIYNGGFRNTMASATNYKQLGSTCDATSNNCQGQAGDLIVEPSHVVLIIGTSDGKYKIAEASGKQGGVRIRTLTPKSSDTIVKLDSFYNNPANKNSYYPEGD